MVEKTGSVSGPRQTVRPEDKQEVKADAQPQSKKKQSQTPGSRTSSLPSAGRVGTVILAALASRADGPALNPPTPTIGRVPAQPQPGALPFHALVNPRVTNTELPVTTATQTPPPLFVSMSTVAATKKTDSVAKIKPLDIAPDHAFAEARISANVAAQKHVAKLKQSLQVAFEADRSQPYALVHAVMDAFKATPGSLDADPATVMDKLFDANGLIDLDKWAEAACTYSQKSIFEAFNHASWTGEDSEFATPNDAARAIIKSAGESGWTVRNPTPDEALAFNAARYIHVHEVQPMQLNIKNPIERRGLLSAVPVFVVEGMAFKKDGETFVEHHPDPRDKAIKDQKASFESAKVDEVHKRNFNVTSPADVVHERLVFMNGKPMDPARQCAVTLHEFNHAQTALYVVSRSRTAVERVLKDKVSAEMLASIKWMMREAITEGMSTAAFTAHRGDTGYENVLNTHHHFDAVANLGAGLDHAPQNQAELQAEKKMLASIMNAHFANDEQDVERLENAIEKWAQRFWG